MIDESSLEELLPEPNNGPGLNLTRGVYHSFLPETGLHYVIPDGSSVPIPVADSVLSGEFLSLGDRVILLRQRQRQLILGKAGGFSEDLPEAASQTEVNEGLVEDKFVSPATLAPRLGLVPVVPESIEKVGASSKVTVTGSVIEFENCTYLSLNGIFTSEFENYRLLLHLKGVGSTTYSLYYRLRAGGVDKASADQRGISLYANTSGTVAANGVTNATALQIGWVNNLGGIYTTDLYSPAVSTNTRLTTAVQCYVGGMVTAACYDTVPYDGLTLFNNSAVAQSGTLQVLGYNPKGAS